MTFLTDLIYQVAQSPLALVVLAGLLLIDGFFPFVPGETAVVTLATLGAAGHGPAPLIVLLISIISTMAGDGIAFAIGRKFGPSRWAWMRRPKVSGMVERAASHLQKSPGPILIAAKFVPIARVAVTATAAASGLPVRRYLACSLVASTVYTAYHVVVATTAGTLFAANPLFGLAVSIGVGLVIAALIAGIRKLMARDKAVRV
ncbi:hypothetical protein BH09ACT1_BH09ACT1_07010 [soil metagenome]